MGNGAILLKGSNFAMLKQERECLRGAAEPVGQSESKININKNEKKLFFCGCDVAADGMQHDSPCLAIQVGRECRCGFQPCTEL